MKKLKALIGGLGLCLLLVTLCTAAPPMVTGGKITPEDVDEFLKYADAAIEARDIDGVMALLAADALVGLKVPGPEGFMRLSLTMKEYKQYLAEAWKGVSDYSYKRGDVQVSISPDGKIATITDTVTETLVTGGEKWKSVTEEESILELRNGRILTISIEGVVLSLDKVE